MDHLTIRAMYPGEESAVAELVLRSFRVSVAGTYLPEGVAEFERLAAPEQFAVRSRSDHKVLVAKSGGAVIGMIEIRQARHISMLFVDPTAQRCGNGRALVEAAVTACREASGLLRQVTVNATPNSLEAYRRFAFESAGGEQTFRGIRFVPMVRDVSK